MKPIKLPSRKLSKLKAQLAAERSWLSNAGGGRKRQRLDDERERKPVTLPRISMQHMAADQ
jgi:hypothetical protein